MEVLAVRFERFRERYGSRFRRAHGIVSEGCDWFSYGFGVDRGMCERWIFRLLEKHILRLHTICVCVYKSYAGVGLFLPSIRKLHAPTVRIL